MKLPIVGPTYQLATSYDSQRCVNLYPIVSETGTSKEISALRGTPGLRLFAAAGAGPIRGFFTTAKDRFFVVSGDTVYESDTAGTLTSIGTLLTQTGRVSITENGLQLLIVDGDYGYIYNFQTTVFTRITAAGFAGGTSADFQDGYFIVSRPRSGQFAISGLYDGLTWAALDFTVVESSPDDLLGIISDHGELWAFGKQSIEIYQNTGNAQFPFERISGAAMETGCEAFGTVQKFDNTLVWLGKDKRGGRIVLKASGSYSPEKISTQAIDEILSRPSDVSGSFAYSYHQNGHPFYCLQVQGLNTTLCYDGSTGQWHERVSLNTTTGEEERHPVGFHAVFNSRHMVGDTRNGNIYEYDLSYYSDNTNPIKRFRRLPHIHDEMNLIPHSELHVDFEPGVGITTGQGSDPQCYMRYSNDGGFTWGNERWRPLGKKGKYKTRTRWQRLGTARSRVYEIGLTDPVFTQINGAYLK